MKADEIEGSLNRGRGMGDGVLGERKMREGEVGRSPGDTQDAHPHHHSAPPCPWTRARIYPALLYVAT